MKAKRRLLDKFKATVALEALRGDKTAQEIAASMKSTRRRLVLSRLRSGLSTHLGSLSFEGQGAFAT